jgi:hypothetical protein
MVGSGSSIGEVGETMDRGTGAGAGDGVGVWVWACIYTPPPGRAVPHGVGVWVWACIYTPPPGRAVPQSHTMSCNIAKSRYSKPSDLPRLSDAPLAYTPAPERAARLPCADHTAETR